MSERVMRVSIWLVTAAAAVGVVLVILAGQALLNPSRPLIEDAGFSHERITPNADGVDDVAVFSYRLSRNASVSLTLTAADGAVYDFRRDEPRIAGVYSVDFSGVVDGFVLDGEQIAGEVVRRLIPNGVYTWRLTARDAVSGAVDERSGVIEIAEGDSQLPEITVFSVWPDVFTPNRDGLSDRAEINVYLEKEAFLQVYLLGANGEQIFVAPRREGRDQWQAGRRLFDYEGGVDLGNDPPPDGTYTVVARAQDAEGQIVERTASLTIRNGGTPRAEIVPQFVGVDVVFAVQPYEERFFSSADHRGDLIEPPNDPQDLALTTLTVPVGDMLVFKLTVENYGDVPIRTSGPPPGTVYNQDQRAATFRAFDESGAWRVGIDCTTAETNYPWRWGLGTADTEGVYEETDPQDGKTYLFVEPGARVVVWGGVRLTTIQARNPQNCWAGLIHEDVEVSVQNNFVGSREVELVSPGGARAN